MMNCLPKWQCQSMLLQDMFAISDCFTSSWHNHCGFNLYSSDYFFFISLIINDIENTFRCQQGFDLPSEMSASSFPASFCHAFIYSLLLQRQFYVLQISSPSLWLIFSFSLWSSDTQTSKEWNVVNLEWIISRVWASKPVSAWVNEHPDVFLLQYLSSPWWQNE